MINKIIKQKVHWHKEVFLLVLALLSVALLLYEEINHPKRSTLIWIDWFDFVVACIFLLDFVWLYRKSNNKKLFLKHNWYLLLASIPLVYSWTEALRGLRILRFIRLFSAGEHLEYGYIQKHKI